MAFFKIVYVFRQFDGGWTEVFYDESGSIDDYVSVNAQEREAVLNFRGSGVTLQAKKVIEEGGLRRGKIIAVNAESTHKGSASPKDVPGVSAKCRLNFAGGGGRQLNIRGVAKSDVITSATGSGTQSALLDAGIKGYINYVKASSDPYKGKVLASAAPGSHPWQDVISFTSDPDNSAWTRVNIKSTVTPPAAGDLVYFRGIDFDIFPYIQGYFRVVGTISATFFSIPTLYREASPTTTVRDVQWREAEYDYPNITSGAFVRFGTRDTAGPFRESRGARSGRKVRR